MMRRQARYRLPWTSPRWAAACLALVLAPVTAACTGPANPEPIMLNTQVISMHGSEPDIVDLLGELGATSGAVRLRAINLDGRTAAVTPVAANGSFEITLPGLPIERFRLIAESDDGRFATAVVSTDGVSPEVFEIDEQELGCLRVEPELLDMGTAPAGEPIYGQVIVTNDCSLPRMFMAVTTDNPYFTPASLLEMPGLPLEPGMHATVSITYLSPGGQDEALLIIEPDIIEPEEVVLVVALRANAEP